MSTTEGFIFLLKHVLKDKKYLYLCLKNKSRLSFGFEEMKENPPWTKIMVFCYQNCSSDQEIFLKFEAEGREFAKILGSLEQ